MLRITWLVIVLVFIITTASLWLTPIIISGLLVIVIQKVVEQDVRDKGFGTKKLQTAILDNWNNIWWVTTIMLTYRVTSTLGIGYITYYIGRNFYGIFS